MKLRYPWFWVFWLSMIFLGWITDGVAYAQSGEGGPSCWESGIKNYLNNNSPESRYPQTLFKSLQRPVNVLIIPFIDLSIATEKYGEDKMANVKYGLSMTLFNFLTNSGLYKVLTLSVDSDLFDLVAYNRANNFIKFNELCRMAEGNGVKIIAAGFINDFVFHDVGPLYSSDIKITIKIYSTEDSHLLYSVMDQGSFKYVSDAQLDEAIREMVNVMFDRMLKPFNARIN